MSWTHGLRRVSQLACEALRTGGSAEESVGESCTSSERACGACAGARGQRSPEENRKSKAACVMSSCGGGGFRAHKASYLSWRHVQASRSGSVRSSSMRRAHARVADRERCRISFQAPFATRLSRVHSLSAPGRVRSPLAKSQVVRRGSSFPYDMNPYESIRFC